MLGRSAGICGLLKLGKYIVDMNSCDLGHLSGLSEMNYMGNIGQECFLF